jgi:hypothetical protein
LFLLEARSVTERERLACIIGSAGLSVYRVEQWSNQFRDTAESNKRLKDLFISEIDPTPVLVVFTAVHGHTSEGKQ